MRVGEGHCIRRSRPNPWVRLTTRLQCSFEPQVSEDGRIVRFFGGAWPLTPSLIRLISCPEES